MERPNIKQKYKGLINGKVWKSGSFKLDDHGLALIYRENKSFYVFEDSVSRFTGFVNSFGHEIYEGDLLAIAGAKENQLVLWDESTQNWKVSYSILHDPLMSSNLENCLDNEIVGHIFTHKHLLISPKVKVNPKNVNKVVQQ